MRELEEFLKNSPYTNSLEQLEELILEAKTELNGVSYSKQGLTKKQKKRRKANKLARKQRKSK